MSARVTVTTQAVASPPSSPVTRSGQAFIVGQTPQGPAGVPTQVFGLADYRSKFGARTGGTDVHDAVATAFGEGLGSAYILRAAGASAVKATLSMDTGKIVATARYVGAYYSYTVAYTAATKTITIVKSTTETVTYTGTDYTTLMAAANEDPDVSFVLTALPSGDVAAAPLATGTDDYAAAVPATILGQIDADLGDGAVIWPGQDVATIGAALQTHCAATHRTGITCMSTSSATQAAAIAAAAAVTDGENLVLAWPYVTLTNPSIGTLTVEPVGAACGFRARAIASGTPAQSPVRDIHGTAQYISGVVEDTSATDWQTLNAGAVSVIRTSNGNLRLYGWRTIDAPDGVVNLQGAQFRDTINATAANAGLVAERFVGRLMDGKGVTLSAFAGELTAMLIGLGGAFFAGDNDPGWVVDVGPGVNSTASLARGELHAAIGVRLAPTVEMVWIDITATDAATTAL